MVSGCVGSKDTLVVWCPLHEGCVACTVFLQKSDLMWTFHLSMEQVLYLIDGDKEGVSVTPPSSPVFDKTGKEGDGPFRDWFDPEKWRFKYHGNWGGPGYGAGKLGGEDWSVPAIDELDETFKEHDYDYTRMPHELADRVWLAKALALELSHPTVKTELAMLGFAVKSGISLSGVEVPKEYPWKVVRYGEADHPGPNDRPRYWDDIPNWSDREEREYEEWRHDDPDHFENLRGTDHGYDIDGKDVSESQSTRREHYRHDRDDWEDKGIHPGDPSSIQNPTHVSRGPGSGGLDMGQAMGDRPKEKGVERYGEAKNPGPKYTPGQGSMESTGTRYGEPVLVQSTPDGIVVSGTDFLGPLQIAENTTSGAWTTGTVLFNQPLGINFGGILSRVTRFAKMYEQYQVEQFDIQFDPNIGTSVPTTTDQTGVVPSIVAYIDPDVTDDPAGVSGTEVAVQNAINQKGALIAKAFEPFAVTNSYKLVNGGWLWCNADATTTDPHLRFFGRAVLLCGNTAPSADEVSAGSLYCKWSVRFRVPSGMSVVPNQGMAVLEPTNATGLNFLGETTPDQIWQSGYELQPYMESKADGVYVYPLQVYNSQSGDTYVDYSASDTYWRFDVMAVGTTFHSQNNSFGIASTDTMFVNATGYGGYGVTLPVADVTTQTSFTNTTNATANTGTHAVAVFLIKIPSNCDPAAYFVLSFPSATLVTNVCIKVSSVTSLGATVAPAPLMTSYVKRADGTIDYVATTHEREKLIHADDPDFVCRCKMCVEKISLKDYESKEKDVFDPFRPSVTKPLVIETDSPVVVESVKDYRKKVVRYGEAKNPGPSAQKPAAFRGDQVAVHHCGLQLQYLAGKLPQKAVMLRPRLPTRVAQAKRVVAKASRPRPRKPAVGEKKARGSNAAASSRKEKVRRMQAHVAKATVLHKELKQSFSSKSKKSMQKRSNVKK